MYGTMSSKQHQAETERHDTSSAARLTQAMREPTKAELRQMLTDAVRNTAAMGQPK